MDGRMDEWIEGDRWLFVLLITSLEISISACLLYVCDVLVFSNRSDDVLEYNLVHMCRWSDSNSLYPAYTLQDCKIFQTGLCRVDQSLRVNRLVLDI
jgi:hypothetical protein